MEQATPVLFEVKRCRGECGEVKPLDQFEQRRDKNGNVTLRGSCRRCRVNEKNRRYWAAPEREGRSKPPPRKVAPRGQKWCTGACGECKPLDQFSLRPDQPGSRVSACKLCVAESSRKRYQDPEYRAKHKVLREAWRARNPGYSTEYYRTNRDDVRGMYNAASRRRRARKRALPAEPYTIRDILARDGEDCVLCAAALGLSETFPHPMSVTVEHLECLAWPDSPGDVLSNVAAAHLTCNCQRGDRPHPAAARKRAELLAAEAATMAQ
jgi:hypothetical protein